MEVSAEGMSGQVVAKAQSRSARRAEEVVDQGIRAQATTGRSLQDVQIVSAREEAAETALLCCSNIASMRSGVREAEDKARSSVRVVRHAEPEASLAVGSEEKMVSVKKPLRVSVEAEAMALADLAGTSSSYSAVARR